VSNIYLHLFTQEALESLNERTTKLREELSREVAAHVILERDLDEERRCTHSLRDDCFSLEERLRTQAVVQQEALAREQQLVKLRDFDVSLKHNVIV